VQSFSGDHGNGLSAEQQHTIELFCPISRPTKKSVHTVEVIVHMIAKISQAIF
jgi:hypothetical protein